MNYVTGLYTAKHTAKRENEGAVLQHKDIALTSFGKLL